MLTAMEAKISEGYEEAIAKTNKTVVGQKKLQDYVAANKTLWIKS